MHWRCGIVWAVWVAVCLATSGCGSKNVSVTGKLSLKGQPIQYQPEKETLMLNFVLLKDDKNTDKVYSASIGEDGEFTVFTHDADGIPPGRYRIAVSLLGVPESMAAPPEAQNSDASAPDISLPDRFANKFSGEKSPIIRDIKGSTRLDIDLDKPNP